MSLKRFLFSIVDMMPGASVTGEFVAEGERLDAAFKAGQGNLPAAFGDKQRGLRLFRFRIQNSRTGEFTAIIGQGTEVAAAWADMLKSTYERYRPKNDGRAREANGVCVLLPARADDIFAKGRAVSRSVASFEGDETYEEENIRRAREAREQGAPA